MAKAKAITFWNVCITNYAFPKKLLTDQGCNFESPTDQSIVQTGQHLKRPNRYQYDWYIRSQRQTVLER